MSLPRIRENNRGAPSLYEYNLLVQRVNSFPVVRGLPRNGNAGQVLTRTVSGAEIWADPASSSTAGSLLIADIAFGFTRIGNTTFTLTTGYVYRGLRTPILVPATDFTITANNQYVFMQIDLDDHTAALGTPSTTLPSNSDATIYKWLLYKFSFQTSPDYADIVLPYFHLGNIHFTGVAA